MAVADADALIVRSDIVDEAVIKAAGKLKIVVRAGAGYDNLDLAACTAHNVVAMNTPRAECECRGGTGFRNDALSGQTRFRRQIRIGT